MSAVIDIESVLARPNGIRDVSRLVKYAGKDLRDAEKNDLRLYGDRQILNPDREAVSQFIRIIRRDSNIVFFARFQLSEGGRPLAINPDFNLSMRVVDFFNSADGVPTSKFTAKPPEGKISLVDATRLWEAQSGHPRLIALVRKHGTVEDVCVKTDVCPEIAASFPTFCRKNGFGLISDRSFPLPPAIRPFPLPDRTAEFPAEFELIESPEKSQKKS